MTISPDLFAGILPFVRVAEEHSFGRAAASLGITTPAVSKAIRRLEDNLGVKLLDRSSRVVALTRDGTLFLERCRRAVGDVLEARELAQRHRREPQGEVSLTLSPIVAPLLVAALPRCARDYPRLVFRVEVSDRIARLAHESFDIAVRLGELPPSNLVTRLLRTTRWVTVGAPSYLARRAPPRTVGDLAAHDCLRFVAPNGRPRDWTFIVGASPTPTPVTGSLLVDHGTSLLAAADAGLGLCQVLDFMVAPALRDGRLVEVLAEAAAPGPRIQAVTTPGRARSTNVRAVLPILVEAFA